MVSGVSAFSRPAGGPVTHGPAAQQGVASLHSFICTLQYYSNERPQQRCDEVQDELSARRACSPRTNEPWGVDNEAVCGSLSLQPHFFFSLRKIFLYGDAAGLVCCSGEGCCWWWCCQDFTHLCLTASTEYCLSCCSQAQTETSALKRQGASQEFPLTVLVLFLHDSVWMTCT